ncbi:helix-turn-helix transcriptional regulator, partial [Streptomyces sp. NPDC001657]|uniref:helix-turn-helix domain-containing protein n=1 Tax=Streptomyces sp. NPDC001657 TaxID=3154522 RepID=UPI003330911D
MRELRGRTGLSLAALAARTPYSKSSWERYLNGKKLPPRDAVEALCRLAGEPAGRLLALWELADAAWSGRAAHDAGRAAERLAGDLPRRADRC